MNFPFKLLLYSLARPREALKDPLFWKISVWSSPVFPELMFLMSGFFSRTPLQIIPKSWLPIQFFWPSQHFVTLLSFDFQSKFSIINPTEIATPRLKFKVKNSIASCNKEHFTSCMRHKVPLLRRIRATSKNAYPTTKEIVYSATS